MRARSLQAGALPQESLKAKAPLASPAGSCGAHTHGAPQGLPTYLPCADCTTGFCIVEMTLLFTREPLVTFWSGAAAVAMASW